MKQLTLRGFDKELERKLRELAKSEGISLNQAVLRLLRKATGLSPVGDSANLIGSALDHLFGTWTDAEADELMERVADFEQIDDEMWQ